MTEAILKVLIPALIAGIVSLIVCVVAFFQFLKTQKNEQERFDKKMDRDLTYRLYDLRLGHYPKAFEITDEIYREKGGTLAPDKIKNASLELINWKKGVVNLIISVEARDVYFQLRDILMKQPAEGSKYSDSQVEKIINLTRVFRKQLRRDLGFMYREEKERREKSIR